MLAIIPKFLFGFSKTFGQNWRSDEILHLLYRVCGFGVKGFADLLFRAEEGKLLRRRPDHEAQLRRYRPILRRACFGDSQGGIECKRCTWSSTRDFTRIRCSFLRTRLAPIRCIFDYKRNGKRLKNRLTDRSRRKPTHTRARAHGRRRRRKEARRKQVSHLVKVIARKYAPTDMSCFPKQTEYTEYKKSIIKLYKIKKLWRSRHQRPRLTYEWSEAKLGLENRRMQADGEE